MIFVHGALRQQTTDRRWLNAILLYLTHSAGLLLAIQQIFNQVMWFLCAISIASWLCGEEKMGQFVLLTVSADILVRIWAAAALRIGSSNALFGQSAG